MIAFDISLNGAHLAIAGADDLSVLTLTLVAVGTCGPKTHRDRADSTDTLLNFTVGGLTSAAGPRDGRHLTWIGNRTLVVGDVVSIKVLDSLTASPSLEEMGAEIDPRKWEPCIARDTLAFDITTKGGLQLVAGREDLTLLGFDLCATGTLGPSSLGVDPQRTGAEPRGTQTLLKVGGFARAMNSNLEEIVDWVSFDRIDVGDEIVVAIRDVQKTTTPLSVSVKAGRAG